MLRNIIDSLKPKQKNIFTLEHLQFLYGQLVRNPIINDQNKSIIIESLRQIAELMIWGDQHNSEFFDFFLEKNVLSFFLRILSQTTNRLVKIQIVQTLSILLENIRNQGSIYYILSNNHVNELITHKFDFSDDELLAYYISLMKTLSLKLNKSTIQFFFNEMENDFPLYTEAIKFFNHKDSMIRIAVRTLTLNVYKVEDESVRKFILDKTAVPYVSNIVWYIRDQCYTLDTLVINSSHTNKAKLNDFVAELLDYFYYLHDIFNLGIETLSEVLSDHLLQYLLLPQFVASLTLDSVELEDRLSPLVSLFLLIQVFYIFTYKPLINTLAAALLHPSPTSYSKPRMTLPPAPPAHLIKARSSPNLLSLEKRSLIQKINPNLEYGNKYYSVLLSFIDDDDRIVLASVCIFYSLVKSPAIDQFLLEIGGIYPFRLSKAKKLLEALTSSAAPSSPEKVTKSHHARSLSDTHIPGKTAVTYARKLSRGEQTIKLVEQSPTDFVQKADLNAPVAEETVKVETETSESTIARSTSVENLQLPVRTKEQADRSLLQDKRCKDRGAHLIEKLLRVLVRSDKCRLITLQLTVLLLKELVYSQDSIPNLDDAQKALMEEAYKNAVYNVRECLKGPLGDIFLELFDQEIKLFKQINFDSLLNDYSSLLLPVSSSSMSGIALAKRLPSGDAEKTQKAIQAFLVLRELKYTMLKQKDDKFPLREYNLPLKVKDTVEFEGKDVMSCSMLIGASTTTKKKLKRFLLIDNCYLLVMEPDPRADRSKGKPPTSSAVGLPFSAGIVCNIVPVQSIEMQVDKAEPSLVLTNHLIAWTGTLVFDADDTPVDTILQHLESTKGRVRSEKQAQIEKILFDL